MDRFKQFLDSDVKMAVKMFKCENCHITGACVLITDEHADPPKFCPYDKGNVKWQEVCKLIKI